MDVHPSDKVTKCPHCGGHQLHRHGATKTGTQRFRCLYCGRTCTRHTGSVGAYIRHRSVFRRFVAKMYRAWSVRKEAKHFDVAPSTIWRWRRELIASIAKRRENKGRRRWKGDAVSITHFVGDRRRFWGSIHEYDWMERQGLGNKWLGERYRGRSGTMVHFLIGTQIDTRTLDEVAIELEEGSMARPRIPQAFAKVLAPQRTFWLSRIGAFTPVAYRNSEQEGDYVYIVDPPKRHASRQAPPRLRQIPKESVSPSIQQAGLKARDLYYLFCAWADRFRGISLRYFHEYIAWFLEGIVSRRLKVNTWIFPGGPRWWEWG